MNEHLQGAVQAVTGRFAASLVESSGQVSLVLPPNQLVEACRVLRDEHGFERLSGLTAVDYWPAQEPRFHVVYQLHSIAHNARLGLRVPLAGNAPSLPTIEGVYPSANWHEREVWDMFGVQFEGHSDMRRIMMPEDWEGHPLRKDYPLGYEEVQFTFNYEQIDVRKPQPEE
jgi:NADH-quinone oxidoreductase subunit C